MTEVRRQRSEVSKSISLCSFLFALRSVHRSVLKRISDFRLLISGSCAMLLALSFSADAQQLKVYRVGVLLPGEAWYEIVDGLRVGLSELGLEEKKRFVSAAGKPKVKS